MDNVKLDELLSKHGNVLLSFEVKKLNNDDRYKFDSGYYRKMYKLEKKLYKVLLSLFTPEVREELEQIDKNIELITNVIEEKTGWWRTGRKGFALENNFENMHDPEFASHDTYKVYRNENGYYVDDEEPFNEYFAAIKGVENKFLNDNQEELNKLHSLFSEKEGILNGTYSLVNSEDELLAASLIDYLGFSQPILDNKYTR